MLASSLTRMVVAFVVMAALVAMLVFCIASSRHNAWWRRVIYTLFPLSQIMVMALVFSVIFTYRISTEALLLVSFFALLCVPVDIILTRKLTTTEDRDLARLQIAMLEEQMILQREAYARIQADAKAAQDICKKAHSQLEQARDALNQKRVHHVKADLAQTLSIIENQGQHYCDHRVVDALIGIKMKQCCDQGIDAEFNVTLPRDSSIASTDLCALFSNLIDNAIHACCDDSARTNASTDAPRVDAEAHQESAHGGRIRLNASMVGSLLVVDMSNSVARRQSVFSWKRRPASGLDEHGWGLVILEELARRYGGTVSTARKDGMFITTVLLHDGGNIPQRNARKHREEYEGSVA